MLNLKLCCHCCLLSLRLELIAISMLFCGCCCVFVISFIDHSLFSFIQHDNLFAAILIEIITKIVVIVLVIAVHHFESFDVIVRLYGHALCGNERKSLLFIYF